MNTFDRYLLREWLKIFGLVLIAGCGLLLMQEMYDDFASLREKGARGMDVWIYFLVKMPSFVGFLLPFGLLVSLLFCLGQLHRGNELTAMRTTGAGYWRLMRPVWIVGALCCGLSWWQNATLVPWSVQTTHQMEDRLQFRSQAELPPERRGAVNSVAFDNPVANRMWVFNRYSRFTKKAYGVTVSILTATRQESVRLMASEAEPAIGRKGWVFRNGRELTFEPETRELLTSEPFPEKYVAAFDEDPELMLLSDRKASDLSFFELRRVLEYFEASNSPRGVPYAVRYFGLLATTLSPLIVIAIAIPFAVSGVRVNPAVGVSKSIGLFSLYYILDNIAGSLAMQQIIPPEVAAWIPNVSLAIIAVWLFARLR